MGMDRGSAGVLSPVDQFFELSLLGLLASGFLAVAGSGYLDAPTLVLTSASLIIRALMVATDGLQTEVEHHCDVFTAVALCHQPQDLQLACCKVR